MARVASYDVQMLYDGYSRSAATVYGYLRWCFHEGQMKGPVQGKSIKLIMRTLYLSRPSVINSIKELEEGGLITVDRHYHDESEYYIVNMCNYPPKPGY